MHLRRDSHSIGNLPPSELFVICRGAVLNFYSLYNYGMLLSVTRWIFCVCIFCVCADGFQGFSKAFQYPLQLLTFYFLLWNNLLILKMHFENPLKIPFSVIDRCSLAPTSHWLQGKGARINLSQAASSMILQNHRRQLRNKKLLKPSAHVQKVWFLFIITSL
jgi:hypothetical protein